MYNGRNSPWSYEYTTILSRADRYRYVSKAESEMLCALNREDRRKLEHRLRREEAERKAVNDAASRRRSAPVSGAAPAHRRLQTYDDAMAARMAARRVA